LGKNENYWQKGKPYVDGIRCPQYSSNEQILAAAVKGELDWFSDFLTNPAKELTAKNPDVKHFFPADTLVSLQFNTTKAPFNDLEFRKAVSIAVNRQDLIDIATFGITSPAVYPAGIGPFYAAWIDEKRLEPYKYILKYDPAKAKAILDAAGYVDKDGDGFRDNKDGSELTFKISVPTGWDDWINSVQIMTENLQDIGVNAKMHTPDEGAWFEKIATGDFDVYIMWNNGHASPWEAENIRYTGIFLWAAMRLKSGSEASSMLVNAVSTFILSHFENSASKSSGFLYIFIPIILNIATPLILG